MPAPNDATRFPPERPWTPPRPLPAPIETPRLVLREFAAADAPSLYEAVSSSRETLLPWLPWAATEHRSLEQSVFTIEHFRRSHHQPDCNMFLLGVIDRVTGDVVGGMGPARFHHAWHSGEVGYWIRTDRRGEGLAAEAAGALVTSCLMPTSAGGWGLRRIEVRCHEPNPASNGVARALGLRLEHVAVDAEWIEGHGWTTLHTYAVLAREWDPTRQRAAEGIGWPAGTLGGAC